MSDPLVLDLDGDGIELIDLGSSTTIFDLDDDAFAERVGWVSPHDGLLVHDSSGNGLVDGIGELFGSAEVDGFDELATLDANADGRIDAFDPSFDELLVWRDLNADGVSTPDEMLTLVQAGITRFDLDFNQVDEKAGGNVVARTGNYVRADGGTRDMASVQFGMDESGDRPTIPQGAELGNLPVLPNLPAVAGMPDLRTSMYFDPVLKAMVEDLVFGAQEFDTFVDFVGGGADMVGPISTIEGRFIEVLYRWAEVDATVPEDPDFPYYLQVFEAVTGMPLEVTNDHQRERLADLWPSFVKQLGVQFLFQAASNPKLAPIYELAGELAALDPADPSYLDQLSALTENAIAEASAITPAYEYLSRFTGLSLDPTTGELSGDFDAFVGRFIEDQPSFITYASSSVGGGRPTLSSSVAVGDGRHPWTAWYEDQGSLLFYIADKMNIGSAYVLNVTGWRWLHGEATDHEGTAGADLLDFGVTYYTRVTDGWGPTGPTTTIEQVPTYDQRLFGFEGDDELRGNSGVDRLLGGAGNDLLKGGSGSDMYVYALGDGLDRIIDDSGADDVIYFSSELDRADLRVERLIGTSDLILHFGNPAEGIVLTGQIASADSAIEQLHFVAEDGLDAGDIATLYLATLSTEAADTFGGTWAGETIRGLGGNDTLNGWGGSDRIEGGDGNDTMSGDSGNDILLGGIGDDQLLGQSGNDILEGGAGNDLIRGGGDDDIYRFDRGDGQDTVRDFIENTLVNYGGNDLVELGEGIAPSDITVVQANSGKDLILLVNGTTDQLKLYETTDDSTHRIERVIFADGTIWTHAEMFALATVPTAGDDTFYGGYNSESLAGGDGNDTLIGNNGNDILAGGAGNDSLRGGGDDDTYIFDVGSGQDVIYDYISNTLVNYGGDDAVIFAAGIDPSEITVIQGDTGDDLIIRISGTTDQITLNETVSDPNSRIERVLFADGTVLTHSNLLQMATTATPGNDVFYGGGGADSLSGGAGNDTLIANKGNDILEGGTGDDVLKGGGGNDRYLYSLGDGRDSIYDYITTTLVNYGGTDTLEFGAGILPSDISVSFADSNDDLVLKISGTTDQVVLQETVSNSYYRIEQVVFANGTIWTHSSMVAMASAPPGSPFAPLGAGGDAKAPLGADAFGADAVSLLGISEGITEPAPFLSSASQFPF